MARRGSLPSAGAATLPRQKTSPISPAVVDFRDWDSSNPSTSPPSLPSIAAGDRRLSPLARFVVSALRKHGLRWGGEAAAELGKLRRVTPDLVAEVLQLRPPLPARVVLGFFHWAGRQKGYRHSFSGFNALALALADAGHPGAADQVPSYMRTHGKSVSEKQLDLLVRIHIRAHRPLHALHVLRSIRAEFGIIPHIAVYNRVLIALIRSGHVDTALSTHSELLADGLKEEPITFSILARGLACCGRIDELIDLLCQMRGKVCRPNLFIYTAILKEMVLKGNMDGCLRMWEEMRKDGVSADAMAYRTIVPGLCESGNVRKAYDLLCEMRKRKFLIDQTVYGAVIKGLVVEGKMSDAIKLLKEMVDAGYRCDLDIYNILMGGLCRIGKVTNACKLLLFVLQQDLVPELDTTAPLMVLFVENGEINRFLELVNKLDALGLPVIDHLSSFFSNFVGRNCWDVTAIEVFNVLKRRGFCSIKIYNILIENLCKFKYRKKALLLFEEIRSSKELQPDSWTYNLMIPCLLEENDVHAACSCYNSMMKMSGIPSVTTYSALVKGLCQIGEITAAFSLVKDCLGTVDSGPMEFKYCLNILDACRSKSPEKVIRVLEEMIELGYSLEEVAYCSVIYGFCKYATSAGAREVFATMRGRGLLTEGRYIAYEEMLNEHLQKVTAGLLVSGVKFFGLESEVKWPDLND